MSLFCWLADTRCRGIAENPLWHPGERQLYWKSSDRDDYNIIFRQKPGNDPAMFERFALPVGNIGGFAFTGDGSLLIFAGHGRVWRWRAGTTPVLVSELPNANDKTWFNDVIADPAGRVYCGMLAHDFWHPATRAKHGGLWRLDPDNSWHCLDDRTGIIPNGMGFSPDRKYFYFAVSDEQTIYRYRYDEPTGDISQREVFITAPGGDGITVDREGCLWVAQWSESVTRYSPTGQKLSGYALPSDIRAVSSVTLGNSDYRTLYVTTANYPDDDCACDFCDGGVLALPTEIAGLPEFLAANHV